MTASKPKRTVGRTSRWHVQGKPAKRPRKPNDTFWWGIGSDGYVWAHVVGQRVPFLSPQLADKFENWLRRWREWREWEGGK